MSSQVVAIAASVLLIIGKLLPISALDCFQQAGFLPGAPPGSAQVGASSDNIFTCPATVGQCYKYVCSGNVFYVQKGCLDPLSATQRCDVIDAQCRGQGGNGVCYACSNNRCNAAPPTTTGFPSALISTGAVLSLGLPTAIAVAYLLTAI